MEIEQLLKVEKTFNERVESKQGVKTKLDLFKRFYYWLQKQKPKDDGEDFNQEKQEILNVEYRLIWNCLKVVFEASKREEEIKFIKLAGEWNPIITKFLYEYLDWHKKNIKSKFCLTKDDGQTNERMLRKLLKASMEADFYQMMYIYMQLHLNGILDFKEMADE